MTNAASARRFASLLRFGSVVPLGLLLSVSLGATGHAAPPDPAAPEPASQGGGAVVPEAVAEPASWRFKKSARPVKLILIAGSIGAWPKQPYARQIEAMCPRVETKNLSKVGMGAFQLKQRFKAQVLENRWIPFHDDQLEFWLAFQGGLNSVGMPEKTNRYIRDLFVLAHRRGMKVLGLTLTPWGDADDRKRWVGANALRYKRSTQKIVDFVAGRLSPREALGQHVSRRADPDAPWDPSELADIGVDLYDSPLRDYAAVASDLSEASEALKGDRRWLREHAELSPEVRALALEADARELSEVNAWWLRPELRSFDHIHPNTAGHTLMTQWMCPQLPQSWGCNCARQAGSGVPSAASARPLPHLPYF